MGNFSETLRCVLIFFLNISSAKELPRIEYLQGFIYFILAFTLEASSIIMLNDRNEVLEFFHKIDADTGIDFE